MVREYKKIHRGGVKELCVTTDSKYLFTSDARGCIKQWTLGAADGTLELGNPKLLFSCLYHEEWKLGITGDNQWLMAGDKHGRI